MPRYGLDPEISALAPTLYSRDQPNESAWPAQARNTSSAKPTMFRRAFSTSARLLREPKGKLPAPKPYIPPRLRESDGSTFRKLESAVRNPDAKERPFDWTTPSSEDFISSARAKPSLMTEQRSGILLFHTIVLLGFWFFDPPSWAYRWQTSSVFGLYTQEQQLIDQVCVMEEE
jgi:hypothetical protein